MRKSLLSKGIGAFALLALGSPAGWPQAPGPGDPIVKPDSPFIEAVRRRPASDDALEMLTAKQAFFYARDAKAQEALDHYLAAQALAKLNGVAWPVSGTIGDIVASPPAAPSREEREKILAALLRPSLAPDAMDPEMLRGAKGDHRQLGPALWGTEDQGSLKEVHVPVRVENVSGGRVLQYEAYLAIDVPGRPALRLACKRPVGARQLEPGQSSPAVCSARGSAVLKVHDLADTLEKIPGDPSRWRLDTVSASFEVPHVNVTRTGVFFLDTSRARQAVELDLRAADCRRRGACLDDLRQYGLATHPASILMPLGFGVMLAIGIWIGRRSDHISRAMLKVFLALCLLALVAVGIGLATGGELFIVVGIIVAIGAGLAIGLLMVALMMGVAIGRVLRR